MQIISCDGLSFCGLVLTVKLLPSKHTETIVKEETNKCISGSAFVGLFFNNLP
jgi:hypothetical protein